MTRTPGEHLRLLETRAHVHTPGCYGTYEPCGEHHAHDNQCGSRPILCRQMEDPDLVWLLAEYQRYRAQAHGETSAEIADLTAKLLDAQATVAVREAEIGQWHNEAQQCHQARIAGIEMCNERDSKITALEAAVHEWRFVRAAAERTISDGLEKSLEAAREQIKALKAAEERWRIDTGMLVTAMHEPKEGESIVDCVLRTIKTLRTYNSDRQAEIHALTTEVHNLRNVTNKVNAAINRAGIHGALEFHDAIDKLTAERNELHAECKRVVDIAIYDAKMPVATCLGMDAPSRAMSTLVNERDRLRAELDVAKLAIIREDEPT